MSKSHKNKSRTRLYNAIAGAQELTGAGGIGATMDVVFTNNPSATETLIVTHSDGRTTTFTFGDGTGGTVDSSVSLAATLDNLRAAIIADSVLGAWGVLNPVNAVGIADDNVDTLTFTFWPGTWANAAWTVTGTAEVTGTPAASGGVNAPYMNPDYRYAVIDSTGGTQNKEYWHLPDGSDIGDTKTVLVKLTDTGDTPTIIGHLSDSGVDQVEALFANEDGMSATFMWDGDHWELIAEGNGTALTFDAAT